MVMPCIVMSSSAARGDDLFMRFGSHRCLTLRCIVAYRLVKQSAVALGQVGLGPVR